MHGVVQLMVLQVLESKMDLHQDESPLSHMSNDEFETAPSPLHK